MNPGHSYIHKTATLLITDLVQAGLLLVVLGLQLDQPRWLLVLPDCLVQQDPLLDVALVVELAAAI